MSFVDDDPEVDQLRRRYRSSQKPQPNGIDPEPGLLVDPTTLAGQPVPERRWLVADWIPMSRVTAIFGAGGEGKTLLAQMLATACATGKLWLGLPTRKCRSLLVYCEDDVDEMHRRQEDINRHYGCNYSDIGAMRWLPRLGHDNTLAKFADGHWTGTNFFDLVSGTAKDHGAELIIVDTVADVFPGNENDRVQARSFAQSILGNLAREPPRCVLMLGHPSRLGLSTGTGESGSTAWTATFRSHCYLSTPKADSGDEINYDARVLTRVKSNLARRDDTIELRWKDGVFARSDMPTGIIGSIERKTCERIALDLIDRTATENQPVSSNSRAGNYAPRLFARRPAQERQNFKQPDFERAMQALLSKGEIKNEAYGRKGDERYRLVTTKNEIQVH